MSELKRVKANNSPNLNLFLISRPIDLLLSIDLVLGRLEEEFIFLIFPNSNVNEQNGIEFLKSKMHNELYNVKYEHFNTSTRLDTLNLLMFQRFIKKKFRNIKFKSIGGSGGPKSRLAAKWLSHQQFILTDEGTYSFERVPQIIENNLIFNEPQDRIFKILYRLFRITRIKNPKPFIIFTIFEELRELKDYRVEVSNLSNLKNILHESFEHNYVEDIIVLGTHPFYSKLSRDIYRKILEDLFKRHNGQPIYLKAHKLFPETYNLPLLETNLPIEYHFMQTGNIPKTLYSFGSTSNRLMSLLYPETKIINLLDESANYKIN